MKFTNFQRKAVSLIVMFTFVALLHFMAAPAQAAPVKVNSETAVQQGDSGGPSFIEEEGNTEAVYKKSKKFPWLIVGLGVVAVGAALYFLVLKKTKYTLTVTLGAGCTGTPAATTKYNKGDVVNYSYTPQAGYGSLQVKLDGVDVPASGTVTMDKDKALTVSAKLQRTLTVTRGTGCSGTPAATTVYDDGTVVNYSYTAQSGYTSLQVKIDGVAVPASGTVTMDKNKALTVTAKKVTYDIRGIWHFHVTGLTADEFNAEFTGTPASGTVRLIGFTNTGTYQVDGINVTFTITGPITFTGKFKNINTMSGTHSYGTWSATRGADAESIPAVPQTIVRQKTN